MSRWNNYAKVLNNTFADYRKEYAAAYDRVAAAKRKADSYTENRPFTTYDLQKQAAAAEYQEAQRAFRNESRSICERYSAAVDQLMGRFREAVEKEFSVRPEFIDQNAMELLKSGIMGVADYESMLSRYSDNPTMLRLIGKYANEEAEKSDTADRQSFRAIAINAGTEQGGRSFPLSRTWQEQARAISAAISRVMGTMYSACKRNGTAQRCSRLLQTSEIT